MKIGSIKDQLKKLLGSKGDAWIKAIVALGLLGMALIAVSQYWPEKRPPPDSETALFTSAGYAAELETRLTGLVSAIEGAGRVQLMITLEDAGETIYAQEETRNVDKHEEAPPALETAATTTYQENVEQRYILIDGENGRREALVRTVREPKIQGVVVLCEGAATPQVEQSITRVVTTALDIPTTKVCVVKISK